MPDSADSRDAADWPDEPPQDEWPAEGVKAGESAKNGGPESHLNGDAAKDANGAKPVAKRKSVMVREPDHRHTDVEKEDLQNHFAAVVRCAAAQEDEDASQGRKLWAKGAMHVQTQNLGDPAPRASGWLSMNKGYFWPIMVGVPFSVLILSGMFFSTLIECPKPSYAEEIIAAHGNLGTYDKRTEMGEYVQGRIFSCGAQLFRHIQKHHQRIDDWQFVTVAYCYAFFIFDFFAWTIDDGSVVRQIVFWYVPVFSLIGVVSVTTFYMEATHPGMLTILMLSAHFLLCVFVDPMSNPPSLRRKDPMKCQIRQRNKAYEHASALYENLSIVCIAIGVSAIVGWAGLVLGSVLLDPTTREFYWKEAVKILESSPMNLPSGSILVLWTVPVAVSIYLVLFGLLLKMRLAMFKPLLRSRRASAAAGTVMSKHDQEMQILLAEIKTVVIVWGSLCAGAFFTAGMSEIADELARTFLVFGIVGFVLSGVSLYMRLPSEGLIGFLTAKLPASTARMMQSVLEHNFFRAWICLGTFMPFGFWVFSCMLKQLSRKMMWSVCKCGFFYSPERAAEESESSPGGNSPGKSPASAASESEVTDDDMARLFTKTCSRVIDFLATWKWNLVIESIYTWILLYHVFMSGIGVATSLLMAELNYGLSDTAYPVMCIVFAIVGITMFLLPPVPGTTVYISGGVILGYPGVETDKWTADCVTQGGKVLDPCETDWRNRGIGFWGATATAAVVSSLLKLVACACQQQLIGAQLRKSLAIRRQVGVHTLMIRSIEHVLSQPGWSFGKVAILCGGPDWPTSVLCGLVGLPVLPMVIGTIPVFTFTFPCALAGAFLLKADEGEDWKMLSTFMLLFTTVMWVGMSVISMSAITQTSNKYHEELTRPRPEDEPLLKEQVRADKRDALYARVTATEYWPTWIKVVQAIGLASGTFSCYTHYFGILGSCFRDISVQTKVRDPIEEKGLDGNVLNAFLPPGWIMLGTWIASMLCWKIYGYWGKSVVAQEMKRLEADGDTEANIQDHSADPTAPIAGGAARSKRATRQEQVVMRYRNSAINVLVPNGAAGARLGHIAENGGSAENGGPEAKSEIVRPGGLAERVEKLEKAALSPRPNGDAPTGAT